MGVGDATDGPPSPTDGDDIGGVMNIIDGGGKGGGGGKRVGGRSPGIDDDVARRATDAVRAHVCRVLGVDVDAEGDALVPDDGVGSDVTRVDWSRVGAVADRLTIVEAIEAEASGSASSSDATAASPSPAATTTAQDSKENASSSSSSAAAAAAAARASSSSSSSSSSSGRIGPPRVEVDRAHLAGDARLDDSGCVVLSHSNFSSVRATCCVFDGAWEYEVTIGTSGIMQLGWATFRCPFTHEHGVGDAQDSYAYDGHRVKKWNVTSQPYGHAWVSGDVISVRIDLRRGQQKGGGSVSYSRNGIDLGTAFDDVRRFAPGLAYFPAVSLSVGERCALNFGDAPLRYPTPGFRPLQDAPSVAVVAAVTRGLGAFERAVASSWPREAAAAAAAAAAGDAWKSKSKSSSTASDATDRSAVVAEEVLLAAASLRRAGPHLASPRTRKYFVQGYLLPALLRAASAVDGRAGETPRVESHARGIRLLRAALDPDELEVVIPELMRCAAEATRTAPMTAQGKLAMELPRLASHAPLAFAVALTRDAEAMTTWLRRPGWGAHVEGLLTRRVPNPHDLAVMLPAEKVWWPGCARTEPRHAARWHQDPRARYPGCASAESESEAIGDALSEATRRTNALVSLLLYALATTPARAIDPDARREGEGGRPAPTAAAPGLSAEDVPADANAATFVLARRAAEVDAGAIAGDPETERRLRTHGNGAASFVATTWCHGGSGAGDAAAAADDDDDDDDDANEGDCVFAVFVRFLAHKNRPTARSYNTTTTPPGHSDPTVLSSAYFALLTLLHPHLESPEGTALGSIPPRLFWRSFAHEMDLPLFGGGSAHVRKTYPAESDTRAPASRPLTIDPRALRTVDAPRAALLNDPAAALRSVGGVGGERGYPADPEDAAKTLPLATMWDALQLIYHLGVSYHFKAASYQLQAQIHSAQQLEDASRDLENTEKNVDRRAALKARAEVLEERLKAARVLQAEGREDVVWEHTEEELSVARDDETAYTKAESEIMKKLRDARTKLRDETMQAARLCWWHRSGLHRPELQAGVFAAAAYGAASLLAAMDRGGGGGDDAAAGRKSRVKRENVDGEEVELDVSELDVSETESDDDDDDDDDDEMDAASKEAKRARVLRRRRGCLLPHVPAYHLETLIDSFHALRRGDPPFSPTSPALDGLAPGMHGIIRLLVKHFADTRVVNPDIRDAMLQSVSVLLQYKEFVAVFEQNDAARDMMVPSLLACFDARFWIPVSNILLRLCKGVGFGQEGGGRDAIGDDDDIGTFVAVNAAVDAPAEGDAALARVMTSPHPDSASPLFQRLLILHCRADRELLAEFLDRLFNTLNWTITEFSVACKELLEDQRSNLLTPEGRQHQRKCTVMFELSVTLERVLEFISLDLPSAFLDSSSLDLRRLRESLLFVLGHATTGPDAANFEEILTKNLAPPDKVSRAAILAPIAGILLNLDAAAEKRAASASQGASCEPRSGYKSSIVTELARNIHSRDVSQLEYLRDFEWPSSFETPTSKLAALRAFVEKVREGKDEVARVHEIEDAAQVPEEFVDPIMQTTMTDPVTLPGSGVVVDRETIKRHLLCDGSDPFSRSPLDESMLVDAVELRERIEKWREETHTPMKEKAEAEEEADGTFD